MSVFENILVARHLYTDRSMLRSVLRSRSLVKREQGEKEVARKLLEWVGLTHEAQAVVGELSTIKRQKLAIAMALATDPQLLLLDEPLAGIGEGELPELVSLLFRVRQSGVTLVVIEHRMRVIMRICDRIIALSKGEKIAEGTPAEIGRDEQVIIAYLGARYLAAR